MSIEKLKELSKSRHLGDGVYARFDGYQIVLAANHHTNDVISLEPAVLERLQAYSNELKEISK